MIKVVYKVVRITPEGKAISAAVTEPEAQLEYYLGFTTKAAPGSLGVFVFEKLSRAKDWAVYWSTAANNEFSSAYPDTYRVLECEAVDPIEPKRIGKFSQVKLTFTAFKNSKAGFARRVLWAAKRCSGIFSSFPVVGTLVAAKVKPLRYV